MKLREQDYQTIFYEKYRNSPWGSLQREVKTPIGIIDFIFTSNHPALPSKIIEFKNYKSIKHAIGQLLSYKTYRSDISVLEVVYFDYQIEKNIKLKAPDQGFYQLAGELAAGDSPASVLKNSQPTLLFSNILKYLSANDLTSYYYKNANETITTNYNYKL